MKRTVSIFIAVLTLSVTVSGAQDWHSSKAAALLMEDNTRAGNNTDSYEFHEIVDTPAPKGYTPFYVSHYGRHGSRSNWGDVSYKNVINTLTKAKEAGILTASGDSLIDEATRVLVSYDGMDGRLTPRGAREHELLARRMFNRFPEVFNGNKRVRAVSSTVERCLVSMTAFTNSLTRMNPAIEYSFDTGSKIMLFIDPQSKENYTRGASGLIREYMSRFGDDTVSVLKVLFTDPVAARKFVPNVRRFQDDIFNTAVIAEDFDIEENVFRYLPFDEIYKRWANSNLSLYMNQCNSKEYGEGRTSVAAPAIENIVNRADEAIANGDIAADLRFGHDYPLMSIASYLGIEGIGDRLSVNEVCDSWFGFQNISMASNLQLIFYKNKKGDILVKVLYNEQEKLFRGLKPVTGPYYRWDDLKANIKGYLR